MCNIYKVAGEGCCFFNSRASEDNSNLLDGQDLYFSFTHTCTIQPGYTIMSASVVNNLLKKIRTTLAIFILGCYLFMIILLFYYCICTPKKRGGEQDLDLRPIITIFTTLFVN